MAKATRPSIADQLAQIATRPPDHVTTRQRDDAAASDQREQDRPPGEAVSDHVAPSTGSRGHIASRPRRSETAEGFKIRQRVEKPHVSLYAHPRVLKKVREIAVAEGCKAHDVYVEGLRLVLAKYGFDYDQLDRGEG